jgi:hypothetical protein
MSAPSPGGTKTVEVTVAAGRSLVDASGKTRRQGEKAQIDPSEVKHLRALGFLAERGEEVSLPKPGLSISAEDGPRVTVA